MCSPSKHGAIQLYSTVFFPRISYPSPCTSLSPKECNRVESPAIISTLRCLNLPRTFPRVLVFGPRTCFSLGLPSLESFQGNQKVLKIVSHLRLRSQLGDRISNLLNWHQVSTGQATQSLAGIPPIKYVRSPWISSLQTFLCRTKIRILAPHLWTPKPLREMDSTIMDNIQGMFSGHALRDINAVRMYLQVTMVSQISSSNGSNIGTSLRLHHIPFDNQSHPMDWPNQPKPSPQAWRRWDSAIATLSADGKLIQPLGDWLLATTSSWKFFTSPHLPNLLLQRSQKGWTSHKKTNGSYWVHFARKGSPIPPPTDTSPTQTTTTPYFIVTKSNTNGNPPLPPAPPPPWNLPLSQHN